MLLRTVVMEDIHMMKCNHTLKFHNQQNYHQQSKFLIETECFPTTLFTQFSPWISINQEIWPANPKLKNHIMDIITWHKAAIKYLTWKAKSHHIRKSTSRSLSQERSPLTTLYRLRSKIMTFFQWIKKNTQVKLCISL